MLTWIFIQARSGSKRFPEKMIQDIKGQSVIQRTYLQCLGIHPLTIVIIPENDTVLEQHLSDNAIPYFKGPEHNVLNRYYQAALTYKAQNIVRVTGDCPVLDIAKLHFILTQCTQQSVDFGSNVFPPRTTIDGNDIEYMSFKTLVWLKGRGTKLSEADCEHVTKHIYDNIETFKNEKHSYMAFRNAVDLSDIKTSIDTEEDLERVRGLVV